MNDCRDCKHFEMDSEAKKWDPENGNQYGVCLVRFGDKVDIDLIYDSYGGGATVGDITVDADFGCKAWEAKDD